MVTAGSQVQNFARHRPALFAIASFTGAALVFAVEPMIAKLLLPSLGGSPSVWNTSLAFFQAALLVGYLYAHFLQRVPRVRTQIAVHVALLALAALTLPLALSARLGDPDPNAPVAWILSTLAWSIGAPFVLLSATAPLVQRWFAAVGTGEATPVDVYPLYAASNLGSLIALVAYPFVIEPFFTLTAQRYAWTVAYGVFIALILGIAVSHRHGLTTQDAAMSVPRSAAPSVADMVRWTLLAAAPSSLMLGVTTYLTTDIASFPFLWVVPLALYLLTFILAFRAKPLGGRSLLILAQSIAVGLSLYLMPNVRLGLEWQLSLHLGTFFVTALLCHQMLADRRPDPSHLTVFYLCIAVGGVAGGMFNAFLAPQLFTSVLEYPLVLILAGLARPWGAMRLTRQERWLAGAAIAAALLPLIASQAGLPASETGRAILQASLALLLGVSVAAIVLRDRGLYFTLIVLATWVSFTTISATENSLVTERSFFGVLRVADVTDPVLGPVRMMYHGTTIHGAQSLNAATACQPLTYYAPETAIGQTVVIAQREHTGLNAAVVGLGTGALASYMRPEDQLTYYEIDPLVAREASDEALFTYLKRCSKSPVGLVLGDARLTLGRLPDGQLDLLVIDAFSSDTVPAHLLTVEALRRYFDKLKPDGVLLLHITNRHLELRDTVNAAVRAAGGTALQQMSPARPDSVLTVARTTAVVASRTEASLAPFRADPRWSVRDPGSVRPWTDDYSDLLGALLAGLRR